MSDPLRKKKAQLLLDRLERISSDSSWAHQASGIRASLAKCLAREDCDPESLDFLMELGFDILQKAASEIPEKEDK